MRKLMLQGKRPKECDYCWKVEDMKKNAISDRVFKTMIYSDEELKEIAEASPFENVDLKTLEVSFDRTCNFACSYCNADYSTTWSQDIKRNGPYQLQSLGSKAFSKDGSASEVPAYRNLYLRAFWKWWPKLSLTLQELRITGGEPLLSNDTWKIIESFKEKSLEHLHLAINSNLGAKDSIIDRLIDASHFIPHLEIYTSAEAVGLQAEYIRDGLNYEKWKSNVFKIKKNGNVKRIHVMMTINALCLFSITDLFSEILNWRKTDPFLGHWTLNILRIPSFMSALVLPDEIRRERQTHLQNWLDENSSNPYILEMEVAGIQRLIHYLTSVESPHDNVSPVEVQRRDFKAFYQQYDQRRKKNFNATFPKQLTDWVDQIS